MAPFAPVVKKTLQSTRTGGTDRHHGGLARPAVDRRPERLNHSTAYAGR